MERPLQILHLHQDFIYGPLSPTEQDPPSPPSDALRVYDIGPLVSEGGDGPRLLSKPALPPLLERREGSSVSGKDAYILRAGDWIFRQGPDAREEEMPAILEAFLRDCWWEGRIPVGTLIARRVREDGKSILQLWARRGE